jgi:hypothetical protein
VRNAGGLHESCDTRGSSACLSGLVERKDRHFDIECTCLSEDHSHRQSVAGLERRREAKHEWPCEFHKRVMASGLMGVTATALLITFPFITKIPSLQCTGAGPRRISETSNHPPSLRISN